MLLITETLQVAWESFQAEFPSACDILLRYSSVRLTLAELVTFIPLIRPRLYSMISCPQVLVKRSHITLTPRVSELLKQLSLFSCIGGSYD